MNILESLLNAQGGQVVQQIGQRFGLQPQQTEALVRRLIPELTGGVQRNVSQPGGLDSLTSALSSGRHERYVDDPASLQQADAENEGNGILGHLFGSKETSREVAGRVASDTGVDSSIVKKLLPLVAAAAMGAMSKQTGRGANLSGGRLGDLLGGLLGGQAGGEDREGAGGGIGDLLSRGKDLLR